MYSSENLVKILPALPKRLEKGMVKNFQYPGGSISMDWDKEKNRFHICMKAARPHTIRVAVPKDIHISKWEGKQVNICKCDGYMELHFDGMGEIIEADGIMVSEK